MPIRCELNLDGVERIDLHFPKFTDGRAFSQAFLLRRRLGFKGEIRATGDVLIDQLVQMQRTGFDSAPCCAKAWTPAPRSASSTATTRSTRATSCTGSRIFVEADRMSAVDLHARPSADFDAKLAASHGTARSWPRTIAPARPARPRRSITQASSLGAEDMVITHLINALQLDIGIFVLETGMLHAETLQLLDAAAGHVARAGRGVSARSTNR